MKYEHLDGLYPALLSLYPARFRARFAGEMVQIFRDCHQLELAKGGAGNLLLFWVRTFLDLAFSIPREWQRQITTADREIDYPGLADTVMLLIVVGMNAVGLGSMGRLTGFITFVLAILIGLLSAMVVVRTRQGDYLRINRQG